MRHEFELAHRADGKTSWREHLAGEWQASGRAPPELIEHDVEPPYPLAYLWQWWQQLAMRRESGMGLVPIAYSEIAAWARLMRRRLESWEVSAICNIDDLYLQAAREQMNADHQLQNQRR